MAEQDITVVLRAEDRATGKIKKSSDQLTGNLDRIKKKTQELRPAFQKMAIIGTASFGAVAAGIGNAINAARNAQDIESLFSLAFDEVEGDAREFVNNFANQFGRSETTVKQAVANMTFQLNSMTDFTEKEMLQMAKDVLPAAEGLALLDPRVENAAQVTEALTDAIAGSRQQFNRLVTPIDDARVKTKALEEGIIKEGEELNRTQEALAVMRIFLDNTTASQEKMKQQNRGATDRLEQFKGSVQDTNESIGNIFIPTLIDLLKNIVPILDKIAAWIEKNPELTKGIVIAVAGITALTAAVGFLGLALPFVITGFGILIGVLGAISAPVLLLGALVAVLAAIVITNWDKIKSATMLLKETVVDIFNTIKEKITGIVDSMVGGIINFFSDLPGRIAQAMIGKSGPIKSAIKGLLKNALPGGGNIPGVPFFQSGGIVPGQGAQPIVAHGGEMVLNRQQQQRMFEMLQGAQGGGQEINIHVERMQNDQDVAEVAKRLGNRVHMTPGFSTNI